jgi:hypothetical protein
MTFTVIRWLVSASTLSVNCVLLGDKNQTFQSNNAAVAKLIWLELELNLSHAYFEQSSLDCECSTAMSFNVTVRDHSVSKDDDTAM